MEGIGTRIRSMARASKHTLAEKEGETSSGELSGSPKGLKIVKKIIYREGRLSGITLGQRECAPVAVSSIRCSPHEKIWSVLEKDNFEFKPEFESFDDIVEHCKGQLSEEEKKIYDEYVKLGNRDNIKNLCVKNVVDYKVFAAVYISLGCSIKDIVTALNGIQKSDSFDYKFTESEIYSYFFDESIAHNFGVALYIEKDKNWLVNLAKESKSKRKSMEAVYYLIKMLHKNGVPILKICKTLNDHGLHQVSGDKWLNLAVEDFLGLLEYEKLKNDYFQARPHAKGIITTKLLYRVKHIDCESSLKIYIGDSFFDRGVSASKIANILNNNKISVERGKAQWTPDDVRTYCKIHFPKKFNAREASFGKKRKSVSQDDPTEKTKRRKKVRQSALKEETSDVPSSLTLTETQAMRKRYKELRFQGFPSTSSQT